MVNGFRFSRRHGRRTIWSGTDRIPCTQLLPDGGLFRILVRKPRHDKVHAKRLRQRQLRGSRDEQKKFLPSTRQNATLTPGPVGTGTANDAFRGPRGSDFRGQGRTTRLFVCRFSSHRRQYHALVKQLIHMPFPLPHRPAHCIIGDSLRPIGDSTSDGTGDSTGDNRGDRRSSILYRQLDHHRQPNGHGSRTGPPGKHL